MKPLALIFLGIAGLLLISYLCLNYNRPLIENDLVSRTSKGLAAAKLDSVIPMAEGQTLTLSGTVKDENSRFLAESLAASINGVSQVNNEIKVLPDSKTEPPKTIDSEQVEQAPVEIKESKAGDSKALPSDTAEVVPESEPETALDIETQQTRIQAETAIPAADLPDQIAATNAIPEETNNSDVLEKAQAEPEQQMQEAINSCQIQFDQLLADKKIHFKSGSAIISDQSNPLLDKLADVTKSCPQFKITITGHTDSSGPAELNQIISEQRAIRVYEALISRGVKSAGLSAVGFGASEPIAPNSTRQGRAQNRRIEFKVEGN